MDQQNTSRPSAPAWVPKVLILLAVVAVGGLVAAMQGKKAGDMAVAPDAAATKPEPAAEGTKPVVASAYKDGAYSTEGNYVSPGGPESIDVTLTLKDGVITDASVEGNADNPGSKMFQGKFIEGYKTQVIGKLLADLSLGIVSGASLTPKGFNNALEEIRVQASV